MSSFLLEIGCEEIPASYIKPAVNQMKSLIKKVLEDSLIHFQEIKTFSTPRRLALLISGIAKKQSDRVLEKVGPTTNIAFEKDGNLTKASIGFLASNQKNKEDIFIKDDGNKQRIVIKIEIKGELSSTILSQKIPIALSKIKFPKTMKWIDDNSFFARPIRWIVALLDKEIVEFEFCKITSNNFSFGNRLHSFGKKIKISSAEDYLRILEKNLVIADRKKRKSILKDEISELCHKKEIEIIQDNKLLETVVDLTEYPHPVIAKFDEKFLTLPKKIIIHTLSNHQKYFTTKRKNKKLANCFIFVSNGDKDCDNIIKYGNQKVVQARLDDAKFYYDLDKKIPLEMFAKKLEKVSFHEKLGTVAEKVKRIEKNALFLCKQLNLDETQTKKVSLAARLSKADLTTLMMGEKEFTSLQGYIGMKYALYQGIDKVVSLAIYEHYLPRGENDILPSNIISAIVALADKMDSVCGIIGIGLTPTGSSDPFAIRRAANGIVMILDKYDFKIDLINFIQYSCSIYNDIIKNKNSLQTIEYIKNRIFWLLKKNGYSHDLIESIKNTKISNLNAVKNSIKILSQFKNDDRFHMVILAVKRISNILNRYKTTNSLNKELLKNRYELLLYNEFLHLKEKTKIFIAKQKYKKYLDSLSIFTKTINDFFDNVLVNDKDVAIKTNRLELLSLIRNELKIFCDFTKVLVDKKIG